MKCALTLLFIVLPFNVLAEGCPAKASDMNGKIVVRPCELTINGFLKRGAAYQFTLREIIYRKRSGDKSDDGSLWGIDGGFPWTIITEMTLSFGKTRVSIPRKSFADLTNITGAAIAEKQNGVVLTVAGGDAAGSFTAEFIFRNNRLVERMVKMNEAPDQNWERTVFHNSL